MELVGGSCFQISAEKLRHVITKERGYTLQNQTVDCKATALFRG